MFLSLLLIVVSKTSTVVVELHTNLTVLTDIVYTDDLMNMSSSNYVLVDSKVRSFLEQPIKQILKSQSMTVENFRISFERKEAVMRCFRNNSSERNSVALQYDVANRTDALISLAYFRNLTLLEVQSGVHEAAAKLERSVGDTLLKRVGRMSVFGPLDLFGVKGVQVKIEI